MSPAALAARPRLLNRHRLGRLGSFASTQVLVQALGFAAGLVLVRQMAQQDYGWFTLLLAAISTGGVLADLGLTMGAMAIGGRIGGRRDGVSGNSRTLSTNRLVDFSREPAYIEFLDG